jgi:hypothetical protein
MALDHGRPSFGSGLATTVSCHACHGAFLPAPACRCRGRSAVVD